MSRARRAEGGRVHFWCLGCDEVHGVTVEAGAPVVWGWNGDLELPTFTPSVLVRAVQWPEGGGPRVGERRRVRHPGVSPSEQTVCHSFVTDGRIQYLSDCTHVLAGQTVRPAGLAVPISYTHVVE